MAQESVGHLFPSRRLTPREKKLKRFIPKENNITLAPVSGRTTLKQLDGITKRPI